MNNTLAHPFSWHSDRWQNFVQLANSGNLPHALLLTGEKGVGVERFAQSIAHFLLCHAPMEGTACGTCKACKLILAGSHPDLYNLVPDEKGKQIKVDQVRQLTEFVAKTSQQGGRKLVIINPAEAMNLNAANSLLKCLEEPAGNTVLVLVSTASSQLLPTIRSRCNKWLLPLPSKLQSLAWLAEMGVEDNSEALLEEAGGRPLLAMDWVNSDFFQQRASMRRDFISATEGRLAVSKLAADWSSTGASSVVDIMLVWVEHMIRHRSGDNQASLGEGVEGLNKAAAQMPVSLLFRYRDSLCQRKAQLLSNPNLNAVLVIEEMLLDWKAAIQASARAKLG